MNELDNNAENSGSAVEATEDTAQTTERKFKVRRLVGAIDLFNETDIKKIGFSCVPTGFNCINKAMGGGLRPGISVLGACPGQGKSTLAIQMGLNIARQGRPVVLFSLEIPRERVQAKLISHVIYEAESYGLDVFDIKHKGKESYWVNASAMLNNNAVGLNQAQWDAIDKARAILKKTRNFFVCDDPVSADDIIDYLKTAFQLKERNDGPDDECISLFVPEEAEAAEDKVTERINAVGNAPEINEDEEDKNIPFVIVDYLQFLKKPENMQNASERQIVDDNVKKLTDFAKAYRIPVLLISALNRDSYRSKGGASMQSFKESGSIEYSADTLITMDTASQKDAECKTIKLVFQKQRYGEGNIKVELDYYPKYDTFRDFGSEPTPVGKESKTETKKPGKQNKNPFQAWEILDNLSKEETH